MLAVLNTKLITINQILRELGPDLPLISASTIRQHGATWPQISRVLEIINSGRSGTARMRAACQGDT